MVPWSVFESLLNVLESWIYARILCFLFSFSLLDFLTLEKLAQNDKSVRKLYKNSHLVKNWNIAYSSAFGFSYRLGTPNFFFKQTLNVLANYGTEYELWADFGPVGNTEKKMGQLWAIFEAGFFVFSWAKKI